MAVRNTSTQIWSTTSRDRHRDTADVPSEIEMLRLRMDQVRQAQGAHHCAQPLFDTVVRSFRGPWEAVAERIGCLHQTPAVFGFQPQGGAALWPSSIHDGSTRHGPDFSPESGIRDVARVIAREVEFQARR